MWWLVWASVVVGLASLVISVWVLVKFRSYLSDMKKVMNTGRGWEKRLDVCRDMFLRRTLNG